MVRTQIYMPEMIHKKLLRLAQQRGEPMAQIVREFLQDGLEKEKSVDPSGKTAIQNLINAATAGGPKDLSQNLDHYLYGAPRKNK